jgi:nucleoside-diphosphate-sugar epimerase
MKQRVLVTGASGFIGNYVVQQLLKMNCIVIATSASEEKARQYEWFGSVRYIAFDLKDVSADVDYYNVFQRPDHMIHLAWEGLPNYKSLFHIEENLPRHFGFLKNIIINGLPDLTVTGTCLEYGLQEGTFSEDMPCSPSNPYAVAKDSLRKFLEEVGKLHPFKFKWIRLFYLYGKGQNPNSLLSQLDKAVIDGESTFNMSGGEQVRDYLPVEKVALIIATAALQQKVTGVVNCCSGKPVSIKKFVEDYCERKQISINLNLGHYPYADYEPMRFWGDIEKLKNIMGGESND